ncbi:hypothetical protein [Pukyongiella litopenaei]|uniref:Uncharacterized protein n=1 Tax=Pukyongiella litopenaei TaxID=2605946 RepID=A0A5C2H1J3_9RHOB|nr:hypothetical protein [Pukyongiella litopenaei]QEP30328.1 hypothetical protein C6Y53_19045 [Pukyongiella litopenaei]
MKGVACQTGAQWPLPAKAAMYSEPCAGSCALDPHCGGLRPGQVEVTGSLNVLPWVRSGVTVERRLEGLADMNMAPNLI